MLAACSSNITTSIHPFLCIRKQVYLQVRKSGEVTKMWRVKESKVLNTFTTEEIETIVSEVEAKKSFPYFSKVFLQV